MSDFGSYPPPPNSGWQQPQNYQQVGYGYAAAPPTPPLAGFWIRFGAALLDGLLLAVPSFVIGLALAAGDSDGTRFTFGYGYTPGANLAVQGLSTVIGLLYFGLLEGGSTGQTLGKRACGIRVVDVNTGQPGVGVGRGIGRYFARFLSELPLLLGYLWMLWDPKKQTWHDKLCSTVVVRG